MKKWTFKSEQEPDVTLVIASVTYEGAYTKLKFLAIKPDLWELDNIQKMPDSWSGD